MRSSLLSTMRRRSTIVVASAGLVTVCATSAVAVALPEDHAHTKPATTAAAAPAPVAAAKAQAAQPAAAPAQPQQAPAQQPQPAAAQAQPQQPQQAQQAPARQAASRSEQRVVLAAATDTSPSGVQALARTIVPADQFAAFNNIVSHESSWNINATNASSGAYGLGQALPASKMASVGSDWRTNPQTQIKWALDYMNSRYGSPNAAWAFWQTHHWY